MKHFNFNLNYFLACWLFFAPFVLMAQCPITLTDVSSLTPNPDGTDIAFPNSNCDGGGGLTGGSSNSLSGGANIIINGETYVAQGFCDGSMNEVYSNFVSPVGTPAQYEVDFDGGGTDCKYSPAGTLIPNVPTLSEWGLLILALMFMTIGTLYLINNKVVAAKEQQ